MGRFVSTESRGPSAFKAARRASNSRSSNVPFVPGLKLSELFYREKVGPILAANFPAVRYSAALLGSGSEVLGYDTKQSTDHHWGPRLQVFLSDYDHSTHAKQIDKVLSEKLPVRFRGYSTNFGPPDQKGVRLLTDVDTGPINHRVELTTIRSFFEDILGIDPEGEMRANDWLTIPEQALLSITAGRVYHDGLGRLARIREKFAYYPNDVWRHLLAAQWTKIGEEEAFIGRTGANGDELGSRIIAARLVEALMKLCFLMKKKYAPYSKWFGTAFNELRCSRKLAPIFAKVLVAESWRARERGLSKAYSAVAEMHNALGITKPLATTVSRYYTRPYLVLHAERFADEIRKTIEEPEVRRVIDGGAGRI